MEIRKVGIDILRSVWRKESEQKVRKEEKNSNCSPPENKEVVTDISSSTVFSLNRAEKIEELKLLIEEGLYKLDSKAIAKNIVEELLNG